MSTKAPDYGNPETRSHILHVTWTLLEERGASLRLTDVARKADVSRQALYLHFGDRTGLLLALVRHMDETLDLGPALAEVNAAPDAAELLRRAMRLNTRFWWKVLPVARTLEASQYDDPALGSAWRDRMGFRQATFRTMIRRIAKLGELGPDWDVETAAELLYGVAHFDTWRELTQHLDWDEERYVETMTRMLCRTLLVAP